MADRATTTGYRCRLVVMVKRPTAGRVKTRLAKGLGSGRATAIYRQMTAALLRAVARDGRWETWLAVTPDSALAAPVWPADLPRICQGGGDLGARMHSVLERMPAGPVVIVGTDVPAVRRRHIASAFRELRHNEAVFGPAGDGGYWLVGLARRHVVPGLFADVRWSGPHALGDTLRSLRGHRVAFLETLDDIDTPEDWRARQSPRRQERRPVQGPALRTP